MADATKEFEGGIDEPDVEHGFRKFNVTEMPRARLVIAGASHAWEHLAIGTEASIGDALRLWLSILVRFLVLDFGDGHAADFLRAEYPKLDMVEFANFGARVGSIAVAHFRRG